MNLEILRRLEKLSRVSHTVSLSHRDSAPTQAQAARTFFFFLVSANHRCQPTRKLEKWKHTTWMIQKSGEKTTSNVEKLCRKWDKPPTSTYFCQISEPSKIILPKDWSIQFEIYGIYGQIRRKTTVTSKVQSHCHLTRFHCLLSNPVVPTGTLVGGWTNPFKKN